MRASAFLLTVFVAACAKDLRPHDNPDSGTMMNEGHFTTTTNGGVNSTRVEATSETEWRYFDLESKKEVTPDMPATSTAWDLAFQRFRIEVNGGSSGGGGMEVAFLPGADFATVNEAPEGPYVTDQPDSADEDTTPDWAFNVPNGASELGWYQYNAENHALSPAAVVFVVKSVEGNYYKIAFKDYYSEAGTSGYPLFDWAPVSAPMMMNDGTVKVDVSGSGYIYLNIAAKGMVAPGADPDMSDAWDLAVDEAGWKTNSGGTRAGKGGARLAPAGAYESVAAAGTVGYVVDRTIPFPGPPGSGNFLGNEVLSSWYNYDDHAHTASSKQLVYLVRTADGGYGKLQIVNYDNPTKIYTVKMDTLPRQVETATAAIDAGDRASFTYFSLRLGASVSETADWDLGFSGAKVKTNGGSSGSGMGGALDPGVGGLTEVTSAPASGYVADAMIPDPDAPAMMYSGNPVLADWYAFAATSTAPKDKAFVVRTANGDFAKLKITGWQDGRFSLDFAYAGPGQTSF